MLARFEIVDSGVGREKGIDIDLSKTWGSKNTRGRGDTFPLLGDRLVPRSFRVRLSTNPESYFLTVLIEKVHLR